jgi:hypothetical protein
MDHHVSRSSLRRRTWFAALATALAVIGAVAGPGGAHEDRPVADSRRRAVAAAPEPRLPAELAAVREALRRFEDPVVAVREGYFSTLGCVSYRSGGMGVHFLNPALIGPTLDPMRPQILVYEPVDRSRRLRLVAAEWFVPLATGVTQRPVLFGRPFDGPMEGHEPLMPRELHHYDLHVWLFKDNPDGMFNATNRNVSCAGHGYSLLEEPPPIVRHDR